MERSDFKIKMSYELTFTKEELTLACKSLTGNLRPEEINQAKELGLKIMSTHALELQVKLDAARHALSLAEK